MHILILNWRDPKNPRAGGAETVTLEHAKAWRRKGHHVTWFTSCFPKGKASEIVSGVKIVRYGNWLTVFFYAPWYYLANRNKIDLIIDEIHGLPFFTPVFTKKPIIAFIHEVATNIWDFMYPFPLNILGRHTESFYLRLYKKVKFWTDAQSTVADLTQQGISEKLCTVINCPATNKPLEKLPEKEKNPTFIFVSRLVRMKGIEEVIKAFSFVKKEIPKSRLWIVGGGEQKYLAVLKRMVRDYKMEGRVTFWNRVSEEKKLALMRKAQLLLHASVKEGWGLVVIEAASQGTPSIVYNVAGLKDSVKDGVTGLVLEENTPHAMANAVMRLLKNPTLYHKLQKESLKWAKSLTWKNATRASLNLLKSA